MTLGAGLVLSGCGDDDTATTPAPAPPPPPPPAPEPEPEPEPPAPEAPDTPTGLHVDETTESSITWHWNAVEGAIGYAVQVSMNEMFDATDAIAPTAETHYTVSDLMPETSVYLRVAAAAGTLEAPILSDWSTHVTGMSAMPPPEPPPMPDPLMATFSIEKGDFLEAGKGQGTAEKKDPARAMASVNPKIMVSSNTSAVITPEFVEDAAGVSVMAGDDNMPFTFVDWQLLQTDVIESGATFKIQRTTMGANQEMEPTGDVMYITCGPFACTDGMDAPEISVADSPKCQSWAPTMDLEIGYVDNSLDKSGTALTSGAANHEAGGNEGKFDGVDAGWVYTSSLGATVIHHFGNTSVTGRGISRGTSLPTALSMSNHLAGSTAATRSPDPIDDDDFGGRLLVGRGHALTSDIVMPCGIDALFVGDDSTGTASPQHLEAAGGDSAVTGDTGVRDTYNGAPGRPSLPENCFRIVDSSLDDYSVELIPSGASVSWGTIDWKAHRMDNPFEGLTCDSMTFAAADYVDVCELFESELDYNLRNLVSSPPTRTATSTFTVDDQGTVADATTAGGFDDRIAGWSIRGGLKKSRQFDTVWYDHDGMASTDMIDLYVGVNHDAATDTDGTTTPNVTLFDLGHLLDDLGADGDFGKIDLRRTGTSASHDFIGKNGRSGEDGRADNYGGASEACSDDDGAAGCDAVFKASVDVMFATGTDFRCEAVRTLSITCNWDAQGKQRRTPPASDAVAGTPLAPSSSLSSFATCTVSGPS